MSTQQPFSTLDEGPGDSIGKPKTWPETWPQISETNSTLLEGPRLKISMGTLEHVSEQLTRAQYPPPRNTA